jgi:aryl-alcohol dehydrogenase-like predicted oxidoreductase
MATLTGKYLNGARPAGARMTLYTRFQRYSAPHAQPVIAEYVALARKHGIDPGQMALAFVNSRPFVTSSVIGATNLDQLKQNIDSVDVTLPPEVLSGIEDIYKRVGSPCP